MKTIRSIGFLMILVALVTISNICINQRTRIANLKEAQSQLCGQQEALSARYATLLAVDEGRKAEIERLRREPAEILRLRNELGQARRQLAEATAEGQVAPTGGASGFSGYVTKELLKFAGFDSPENALQSLRWASTTGDYTNWLAALSPRAQEQELADAGSPGKFERAAASESRIKGMQVIGKKQLDADRVELAMRLDFEGATVVLVYPMVTVGNEWRLGDEIHAYTEAWAQSSEAGSVRPP